MLYLVYTCNIDCRTKLYLFISYLFWCIKGPINDTSLRAVCCRIKIYFAPIVKSDKYNLFVPSRSQALDFHQQLSLSFLCIHFGHDRMVVVSLNPTHGEVYSIQVYVIKFVSDLWQVSDFFWVIQFHPPIKLTTMI